MVSKLRTARIAERIRQELSELLQRDIQDPRLEGIYFTDATVDRELSYAEIYVSALTEVWYCIITHSFGTSLESNSIPSTLILSSLIRSIGVLVPRIVNPVPSLPLCLWFSPT